MTALNKQIQLMHSADGYTIEQIADSLSLTPEAVTLALAQNPVRSQNENCTAKQILGKFAEVQDRAVEVMANLLDADEAPLRFKAAEYILDAGLGLKTPKASTVPLVSAATFNDIMREAQEAYRRQLQEAELESTPCTKVINV